MSQPLPEDPYVNPFRQQIANYGLAKKPDAYTPYAAGAKTYGYGARTNATSGPVSADGLQGYVERDNKKAGLIARQAMLNKLKAGQAGNYASAAWLGGPGYGTNS